jgi:Ca2+-binding EF-hand superfamily protein
VLTGKFWFLDADRDQVLSATEYIDSAGAEYRDIALQEFGDFDADANLQLSYEEFLFTPRAAVSPPARFARLDGNGDLGIDRAEFLAPFAPSRHASYVGAFDKYDRDGDLRISRDEFIPSGDPSQAHLRGLFALHDTDGDGRVSRSEYSAPHIGGTWEQAARQESVEFDRDGDGFLTLLEFALTPRGTDDLPTVFELFDADGDQRLSRDEFLGPQPPIQRTTARATFYNRDTNGDAVLSREEFMAAAESVRPNLQGAYAARDIDEDGRMSRAEYFAASIGSRWEQAAREEADQFDLDGDGMLTLREFGLSPGGGEFAADLMRFLDADQDGRLSVREYVMSRPGPRRTGMKVEFYRRDRDHDGQLELPELQGAPAALLHDPIEELAQLQVDSILAVWREFDEDGNGTLNRDEFPAAAKRLAEADTAAFARWDLNSDAAVTQDELRSGVLAAFGVRRLDGKPLRQADAIVINWAHIHNIDRDHDDILSREEFVTATPQHDRSAERFAELDQDGNGVLDDVELIDRRLFSVDVVFDFCRIDTDLNDRLTPDEIVASAHPWQQELCGRLMKAYDADRDGSLDYNEYRLTPFANPLVEWYKGQRDEDRDGRLSWNEFLYGDTPRFMLLARDVFEHFDLDDDGILSAREFDFDYRLSDLPVADAFAVLDRDASGALELSDFTERDLPESDDPTGILHREERTMQVDEGLRAADRNADGRVTPDEFSAEQAVVVAALSGQAPPRASIVSTAVDAGAQAESWNWRFIGLVGFNVLLLAGLVWFASRSMAS